MRLLAAMALAGATFLSGCGGDSQVSENESVSSSSPSTTPVPALGRDCRLATFPAEPGDVQSVAVQQEAAELKAQGIQVTNATADPVSLRAPSAGVVEAINPDAEGTWGLVVRHPCGMKWELENITTLALDLVEVARPEGGAPESPTTLNPGHTLGQVIAPWSFSVSVNDSAVCPIELLPPTDNEAFKPLFDAAAGSDLCRPQ